MCTRQTATRMSLEDGSYCLSISSLSGLSASKVKRDSVTLPMETQPRHTHTHNTLTLSLFFFPLLLRLLHHPFFGRRRLVMKQHGLRVKRKNETKNGKLEIAIINFLFIHFIFSLQFSLALSLSLSCFYSQIKILLSVCDRMNC